MKASVFANAFFSGLTDCSLFSAGAAVQWLRDEMRLIKNAGIYRIVTSNGVIYQRDSQGILRRL